MVDRVLKGTAGLLAALIVVLGGARLLADATGPDVPPHAQKQQVSPEVTLYHWREPAGGKDQFSVYALPDVKAWPKGAWGVEVTLTPVPLCCGATVRQVRWRKSELGEPRFLSDVSTGSRYRLDFRYR